VFDRSLTEIALKYGLLAAGFAALGAGIVYGISAPERRPSAPAADAARQQQHEGHVNPRKGGPPHQEGSQQKGDGFRWQQDKAPPADDDAFGFGYDKLCRRWRPPSPLGDVEQEALRKSLRRQCGYVDEGRASWHQVDRIIETMGIQPGDVIADIGCASGFHTQHFSEATGPRGTVYAVDLDRVAIGFLAGRISAGLFPHDNVQPLLSKPNNVLLPEQCLDWGFACGVHFHGRPGTETDQCVASIFKAVKPGGHMAVVDEVAQVEVERILQDYLGAGFELVKIHDFLKEEVEGRPADHPPEVLVILERPAA